MIVNTVWIGDRLGAVHVACLKSFLRNGYDVVLHAYGKPIDTPDGVTLFDASRLMSSAEVQVFKDSNLLAFASDIYRYRIQRESLGLYVDCDVFCLRPFNDFVYIYGWESESLIANGVLKLPQNSLLLNKIMEASEDPYFIPPWLPKKKQRKLQFRKAVGMPKHIVNQPWGVIGPQLLTHYVEELNLTHYAEQIDQFYPLHYMQTPLLYQVGLKVSDLITSRSVAIHLSNSVIKKQAVEIGTPMYELLNM